MSAAWPATPRSQRWTARGAVVGLHLLLLAAAWQHRPKPLDTVNPQRISLRWLRPAPPAPARPSDTPPARPPLPQLAPAPEPLPPLPWTVAPQAAPDPSAPSTSNAGPVTPNAEPTAPRTTLRLTLPPGYAASSAAARNPALSDPRSNTARRTLEDRIADAAGATGEWVSERVDDHRTLLRRGDTCVEVLRSRIGDMDRFNESVAPRTVPMFGKPYKCK